MKKSVKGIIGLSAVLVVLGGGVAALKLTEPKEEGDSSSVSVSDTEQQVKVLITDDKVTGTDPETGADLVGTIKTVDVKNQAEEIHVVQLGADPDTNAMRYTIDGYQDIYMNTSMIGTLANNANGLTSENVIEENCTDLAKFGLAEPSITVDIEYETGTKVRMFIGDPAPSGDVTYVMIDGVDTVFTVVNSKLANYSRSIVDFAETVVLQTPDEMPTVKKLRIEREDLEDDILLEYEEKDADSVYSGGTSSNYIMTEPTFAYLAVEKSSDVIQGMYGLYADDIYAMHCTEADIAEAGLKDPFCTVTMDSDDGKRNILYLSEPFTNDENGQSCYGMMKGGNTVFIIDLENAKWVTVQPVDVASRIFIASYVWNVTDLSVDCADETYAFHIERKDPDEEVDKLTADNFNTTLNGESFDTERYRQFYSFLISANAENFALGEEIPKGEPSAVVKITDSYHNETTEIAFYEKTALQSLITVNGESKFTVARSFVDTLIENAGKIRTDEEYKTTWK